MAKLKWSRVCNGHYVSAPYALVRGFGFWWLFVGDVLHSTVFSLAAGKLRAAKLAVVKQGEV